ncbi:MAG: hypothetical protein ACREO3_11135 [Arenimonas sp.]
MRREALLVMAFALSACSREAVRSSDSTFDDASYERLSTSPPTLASQTGQWVVLGGTLRSAKDGPVVVTPAGPVYLRGHVDAIADIREGTAVTVRGKLEHADAAWPSVDAGPDNRAALLSEHFFIVDPGVQTLR